MSDEGITVYIDNGELIDITKEEIEVLQGIREDLSGEFAAMREQVKVTNSIALAILVFVGACLGALIFRHLRK